MAHHRLKTLALLLRHAGMRRTLARLADFLFVRALRGSLSVLPLYCPAAVIYALKRQINEDAFVRMVLPVLRRTTGTVLVPDYALPVFQFVQPMLKAPAIKFVPYSAAAVGGGAALYILQSGNLGPLEEVLLRQDGTWVESFATANFVVARHESRPAVGGGSQADSPAMEALLIELKRQAWSESANVPLDGPLGTQFFVRPATMDSGIVQEVFGEYIAWLKERIGGKCQVVDLGGHIGSFGILCSRLVSPDSQIHVYEPASDNFALLARNIELNAAHSVQAFRQAVSDKPGQAELHISRDNTGGHRLHMPDPTAQTSEMVNVTTLAELSQRLPEPVIDVLKVDVEGSEHAILLPFAELLRTRVRYIICEAGGSMHGDAFTVLRFLRELGFACEAKGNGSLMLIKGTNTRLARSAAPPSAPQAPTRAAAA